ncbi:SDR family NAD(P)-dependent oxidoreductase [Maricaulis alexandrii]|uniref:SDR family NAD(P)-dependent oxidoreductase n=1 Tax=Maricaulis alexandrii TaxID=2570354 RepID=UPI00110A0118|nr:SDR family oxidoreductase [Maricaulis alexandrii]
MTDTHTPIALITGGSRGLGRATALWLARKGADVILTYHSNREAAEATRAEIEAIGQKAEILQLDTGRVSDFPDFAARVRQRLQDVWKRSRLDFLVNNAGQGVYQRFEQTSEAEFDSLVDVHLKGVFFLTQALLPLIIDGGRIVNVSSGLTRITLPGFAAYATMKGAVEVLTRYLALELGERGITVNVLAPGAIETDFGGGMVRDNAEMNAQIAAVTALGRVGQPDDIGGALSSLLMGDTRWMTAQRIEVSGGQGL